MRHKPAAVAFLSFSSERTRVIKSVSGCNWLTTHLDPINVVKVKGQRTLICSCSSVVFLRESFWGCQRLKPVHFGLFTQHSAIYAAMSAEHISNVLWMCRGYVTLFWHRKKNSGWMKRQMVRREEDLNPNETHDPGMHVCAAPWPSLQAVLKLSKITHNWWLSEQLPGAHKALRPRPWERPSTRASCHPSIVTEGLEPSRRLTLG